MNRIWLAGVLGILAAGQAFAAAEVPVRAASVTAVDAHTAQTSLDWAGTYSGILPCADCTGIETLLALNPDNTYRLRSTHLGRDAKVFEETGTFIWQLDGRTVLLESPTPRLYMVAENKLFSLDSEGKRITGNLADNYVLHLQKPGVLTGHTWQLTELRGQKVPATQRLPFLEFRDTEGAVSGSGGCNRLRGGYSVDGAGGLKFSQVATTMMACVAGMDVEQRFLRVLEQVSTYSVEDGELVLYRNPLEGQPVAEARFKGVPLENPPAR